MKNQMFLKDGWFTTAGSLGCFFTGITIVGLAAWLEPNKIVYVFFLTIGLVLVGLAGIEARARALGLQPPFTRDPLGWRKAKESYNIPKDSSDEKSVDK